ncbi:cell division protein FtsQ/DivIB [Pseudonocardia bannensis]|uniref:Cell division protein FtsQ n=1 Tax=Pseudonocardia bannensis TaxID=630973 RepID=A0A848DLJ1_9PSEU|nr:FtsQ-type POTRA domain-containing protein [Pseudonocardia bannensis]NMH93376.1 FtsQ-type POTRA domain-containing protein [Pseudonocardia bannensis]
MIRPSPRSTASRTARTVRRRPARGEAGDAAKRARGRAAAAGRARAGGETTAGRRPPRRPGPAPHHLRRRRLALLAVVVVLLAGMGVTVRVLLYDSGLADVEQVEVTGALTLPVPDVLAAAAVEPGSPLAAVDVVAVADRVAALPGVARVDVSRNWPHTVAIAVTERVAVALAGTAQGLFLVDDTGVAFRPAPEVPPQLPRLGVGSVGPDDPGTTAALDVLAALPEPVRSQVQTIDVTGPVVAGGSPSLELGLTDGRRVRWGSPDRSDRKAAVLVPLLTQEGAVYDVASPELPTVRR